MNLGDLFKGGIKFYCGGCRNEIENLAMLNRVLYNLIYDPVTGKIYHNSLCRLMDKESTKGKVIYVRYKSLEKMIKNK